MDNMELILMREAVDLDYSKEWVDLMNNGRCYRDYCLSFLPLRELVC